MKNIYHIHQSRSEERLPIPIGIAVGLTQIIIFATARMSISRN